VKELEKALWDQDFPLWFDYADTYEPSMEQGLLLNVSKESIVFHPWVNDRLSTKQFALHWSQQKAIMKQKGISKPIFAGYMNVESHMPYMGYDRDDFYDPIDPSISDFSDEHKKRRYIRVNKYADKWAVGETIRFLKEHDNNTIVFITGDHGTRDVPLRSKNSFITNKTVFSGDCVGGSSGCDSFFTTTGVIAYLGSDERVIQKLGLDKLKGKTMKFATDHNDMMYTMLDVTSKLLQKEMKPTHRRARNLFEVSQAILGKSYEEQVNYLDASKWVGLSFLTHQIEFRKGAKNLRVHPADISGAHFYDAVTFPTCLKLKNDPEMELGGHKVERMYRKMFEYLNVENFVTSKNRVYSYQFRDGECIANRNCTFPTAKNPRVRASPEGLLITFFYVPILTALLISIPAVAVSSILKLLGLYKGWDYTELSVNDSKCSAVYQADAEQIMVDKPLCEM
jgi:hypothetical protein